MDKPIAIDLYCGLGGWADGFLAEGYRVIGFDIEAHDYGTGGYPGELILRDVRSIHGSEFADAAVIVASPPCQAYSYRAMPWKRAKELPPPDNTLFDACFRIQREASEAAGHYIPLIVENVRGAQRWVGRARWHFGSYFLWGDIPALMPITIASRKVPGFRFDGESHGSFQSAAVKVAGLNWAKFGDLDYKAKDFNVTAAQNYREGQKVAEHLNIRDGHSHTRHLTNPAEHLKQPGISGPRNNGKGCRCFQDGAAAHGSKSDSRKAASAMIAKIPFPLAQHMARCFKPTTKSPELKAVS